MVNTEDAPHFSVEDYQQFQRFLRQACGIVLSDNKQYLVANRLRRILEELQLPRLADLIRCIEQRSVPGLRERVIDAMTTNETFWFRDNFPFDALRDTLLPDLVIKTGRPTLRIWSAACSFGQEPYSISMILEEFRLRNPGRLLSEPSIIATDISRQALAAADKGCYDQLSVNRGLSEERRRQYFVQNDDGQYCLKTDIKSRVSFSSLNLLDSFAALGKFDIVFCRNVLIYFAADLKIDILSRMHSALNPGGFLILGASESLPAALSGLFVTERINGQATVYRA